jgi:hypothetical protein
MERQEEGPQALTKNKELLGQGAKVGILTVENKELS